MRSTAVVNKLVDLTAFCLKAAVMLWVMLALASVFLITLNTDEAWILLGLRSFLESPVPDYSIEPVPTSGGLFAIANLLLEYLFGSSFWVHRLFSMAVFLASLVLILRQAKGRRPMTVGLLAIAPLLGVPGTSEVGMMAIGTSTGILLFVLASLIWCRSPLPKTGRVVLCGLLFGLSAASRFELILSMPLLVIAAGLHLGDGVASRLTAPRAAIIVAIIAVAILAINCIFILGYPSNFTISKMQLPFYGSATGIVGKGFDYPFLLNKIAMALQHYPPVLLVIASLAAIWLILENKPESDEVARFATFLLLVGWTLWIGWVFRAPGFIYRYLWTSLVCFSILSGLGLARLFQRAESMKLPGVALGCQVIALGLVLGGIGGSLRSLLLGDGGYLYAESGRITGLDYFRRFEAIQDYHRAMAYLRDEIPRDATVMTYPGGSWHTLRYEAHRPVALAGGDGRPSHGIGRGLYFVLTPDNGPIWWQRPRDYVWFERNARLKAQFGRYSFYELPDGLPEDFANIARTYVGHPSSRPWFGRLGAW